MNGPLYGFNSTISAINREVWNSIPADLQQILIEEGAKHELESLRLAAVQGVTGEERNIDAGLEWIEFSPEIQAKSRQAAVECVIPGWLARMGYSSARSCQGAVSSMSPSTVAGTPPPSSRPTPHTLRAAGATRKGDQGRGIV